MARVSSYCHHHPFTSHLSASQGWGGGLGLEAGDLRTFLVTTIPKQGTGEALNAEGHLKSAETGEWEPGGQGTLSPTRVSATGRGGGGVGWGGS